MEHGQDQPRGEDLDRVRQEFHRNQQEHAAEGERLKGARSAFRKALVQVELFGSKPVRDTARAWVKDVDDRYEWLFQTGEFDSHEVHAAGERELRQHRDPFIDLIRAELGVAD